MNKPKTRIGVLHGALKEYGVTQGKLAGFAGCRLPQIKKLVKPLSAGGRELDESYAVGIAAETGVSLDWLMGRLGHWRKPVARWSIAWSPEKYLQIQKQKREADSAQAVAAMCGKYFLVNSERMAQIILAGFKQNKADVALSRIHLALAGLAREFKADEPDRAASILKRTLLHRRPVHKTAAAIAQVLRRGLWAHIRQSPTKKTVQSYQRDRLIGKAEKARPAEPSRAGVHGRSKAW